MRTDCSPGITPELTARPPPRGTRLVQSSKTPPAARPAWPSTRPDRERLTPPASADCEPVVPDSARRLPVADGLHQPYPHYTRASYNALDHVNPVPKVRLSGKSPQVRPHASFRRSRAAVVVRGTPSMLCRMRLNAFWFPHVCSDRINVSVKAPPRKFP